MKAQRENRASISAIGGGGWHTGNVPEHRPNLRNHHTILKLHLR